MSIKTPVTVEHNPYLDESYLYDADGTECARTYSDDHAETAQQIADALNAPRIKVHGAPFVMHVCKSPNPPADRPKQHIMLFTWSQVVEGFLRRFYGIPEPFEAILTKLAPDKLNADTWCQQTESWLH